MLDYFSDVGGLFGAISPIFGILISLPNFYGSYQYIMADLFLATDEKRGDG